LVAGRGFVAVERFLKVEVEVRFGLVERRGGDGALIVGSGHEAGVEEDCGIVGVVDLAGQTFRGDVDGDRVEQVGGVAVVADDFLFLLLRDGLKALAVEDGEFEAKEEGVGAFGLDEVAGEGVDDLREGEHDGDAVFEGRQADDVAALHEALGTDHAAAVHGVALVETVVEVTEVLILECDGAALEAVGADVTAEIDVHDCFSLWASSPPGGVGGGRLKVEWMQ
jgi:hypothetical protein